MEYNLTEKQKLAVTWMAKANRRGELEDEFLVSWSGFGGEIIRGRSIHLSEEPPDIIKGILDGLSDAELISQEPSFRTKSRPAGSKRRPQTTARQWESSRRCTLTQRAFDAVDSNFVMPDPPLMSATINIHGNVNQSIIGTQSHAELTNNLNFGSLREQIERDGGEDKEELYNALTCVERLLERGEYLDRGALAKFSGVMERHSWFTSPVMSALLGFATQVASSQVIS